MQKGIERPLLRERRQSFRKKRVKTPGRTTRVPASEPQQSVTTRRAPPFPCRCWTATILPQHGETPSRTTYRLQKLASRMTHGLQKLAAHYIYISIFEIFHSYRPAITFPQHVKTPSLPCMDCNLAAYLYIQTSKTSPFI